MAVQGFGNVGAVAASLFHEAGAKVVAVQDHRTTLYNPAGLDVPAMMEYASHSGTIEGFRGETLSTEQFWQVDCDILIPAALEGQITAKNAPQIQAS